MQTIRGLLFVLSMLLVAGIACDSETTPTKTSESTKSANVVAPTKTPSRLDPVWEATNNALLAAGVITPIPVNEATAPSQLDPVWEATNDALLAAGVITPIAVNEVTTTWFMVGAQMANVRSCGSVDCAVITTVPFGQRLDVLETVAGWHRIRLASGEKGWIAAYLTSQTQQSLASPTSPPEPASQSDTQSKATKLARRLLGTVESVQVLTDSSGGAVIIKYEVSEADLDLINWSTVETICDFRKAGFTTHTFRIAAFVPVVDRYGVVSRVNGLMVVVTSSTAARINCDNTVDVDLEFIADAYDLHPVMR
jgi:SH3-like domain-containing protein